MKRPRFEVYETKEADDTYVYIYFGDDGRDRFRPYCATTVRACDRNAIHIALDTASKGDHEIRLGTGKPVPCLNGILPREYRNSGRGRGRLIMYELSYYRELMSDEVADAIIPWAEANGIDRGAVFVD